MINTNHNRYVFLDGIRGIAAILVLTRHTGNYWHLSIFRSYLAVDLFFILSGFVIAYAYDEKLMYGLISLPNFVLIRLVRLYPVFILSLSLCSSLLIGKIIIGHQVIYSDSYEVICLIAITALFLPSHFGGGAYLFPMNSPYWSLFFELIANFLYAAIIRFLTNFILKFIVICSGLIVAYVSFHHGNLDIGYSWGYESVLAGFARSIFGIFTGLFLFRHKMQIERYSKDKSSLAWLAIVGITIILTSPSVGGFDGLIDVLAVLFLIPFFVLCATQGKTTKLQNICLMLGSASYPIYVLHMPVGELLQFLFGSHVATFASFSGILLVLLLISTSLWVEKFYDIPLRRWISNRLFTTRRVRICRPP